MENDELAQVWKSQKQLPSLEPPDQIIARAKKHRRGQLISIAVMSLTVLILLSYTLYFALGSWNDFTLGLVLMIASLIFRIVLEFAYLFQVSDKMVSLDNTSYREYLKRHYKFRIRINYLVTPICFTVYVIGFIKLLPFFKQEFSSGFYTYIVVSGFASFAILIGIIGYSILKEIKFLKKLNGNSN
ncbi:MAG: hypothetical protein AAFR97_06590 [Bacteroidota bacterium]